MTAALTRRDLLLSVLHGDPGLFRAISELLEEEDHESTSSRTNLPGHCPLRVPHLGDGFGECRMVRFTERHVGHCSRHHGPRGEAT